MKVIRKKMKGDLYGDLRRRQKAGGRASALMRARDRERSYAN